MLSPNSRSQQPLADHVPGPMEEAAVRMYFERGSKQSLEKNSWRMSSFIAATIALVSTAGMVTMAMRSNIEVFQVAKGDNGQVQVLSATSKFVADEDIQMAWASRFLSELVEVSPALWKRNLTLVQSKVVGTAADQVRSYLEKQDNNPAALLADKPGYVREYSRISVNKIANMTYIVRYEITSRPSPGSYPEKTTYAATINLVNVGHKTREDVFRNPEGLAVSGFSVSMESGQRK
jgi:type IV secretory pathway TrbF-like protein